MQAKSTEAPFASEVCTAVRLSRWMAEWVTQQHRLVVQSRASAPDGGNFDGNNGLGEGSDLEAVGGVTVRVEGARFCWNHDIDPLEGTVGRGAWLSNGDGRSIGDGDGGGHIGDGGGGEGGGGDGGV
eukprot:3447897-Pleurochrysis_carterae.AAC.1